MRWGPVPMSLICRRTLVGCWFGVVLGCSVRDDSTTNRPTTNQDAATVSVDDALVQFSLMASLAADDYVGSAMLRDVLANGDFGVGTFDRLNGEMIVLDGQIYQALADGTIRRPDLAGTTPFAAVTYFEEDGHLEELSAATLDDLDSQLDQKLPRPNSPYALRITGSFAALTLRSVPEQSPPFQPLTEVVKHQVVWEHKNVPGTMVGFRCPAWMGTINVAGYHWHFISDDRKIGGHVFGCEFQDARLAFDECSSVVIRLPKSTAFDEFQAGEVTEQDVDSVERQRTSGD